MSEHAFFADAGEAGDVDVDTAVEVAEAGCLEVAVELHLGVAGRGVLFVVFETVQVLVSLAADVALVRLLLLHAKSSRIRSGSLGVDDGECSVAVLM
jgi:hypothetical protein